jgi:hypothetical protein
MAFSTFRFDTAWIVPKVQETSRRRYFDCNHINPIRTLLLTTHHKEVLRRPYEPTLLGERNCFGGSPHPGTPPRLDFYKDELFSPLAYDIQLAAGAAPIACHDPVPLLLQPDRSQMFASGAQPFAGTGIGAATLHLSFQLCRLPLCIWVPLPASPYRS